MVTCKEMETKNAKKQAVKAFVVRFHYMKKSGRLAVAMRDYKAKTKRTVL